VYSARVHTPSTTKRKALNKAVLYRTLRLVLPQRGLFIIAMLALAGASGINLLFPQIIKYLLDAGQIAFFRKHYASIGLGLVALFAVQAICFYIRAYCFGVIGQRVVASLRVKLFSNLIHRDISFFDSAKSADLVSRISNDAQMLQDTVSLKLSVLIRYGLQVILGIGLMALLSLPLTLTILLILPLLVGISIGLGQKLRNLTREQQSLLGKSSAFIQEAFDGIRLVRAFNREDHESARLQGVTETWVKVGEKRSKVSAFFQSFVSFLLNAAVVFVLLLGVYLVETNRLSSGELTAFLLYGAIVAVSFSLVASGYTELVTSLGAAERIFEMLDVQEAENFVGRSALAKLGDIVINDVHFAYPSRLDSEVLRGVRFKIPAGKITALVGPSGSGKSTIVQLLLQLYRPGSGEILFDGKSSLSYRPEAIRECIALVPQDQVLFSASLEENLRYARLNATNEELCEACSQAQILDFIKTLPEGFQTLVGERGVQLSTGQRQRIAIARALLRRPELLILDEATSALDVENEYWIQKSLEPLLVGRTTLIIAHRLSTIRRADQVVVMEAGKIIQIGSHESLMKESGLYKSLVERNFEVSNA
jgi:ABC-type multidrug transport system fused ATPase/permease subunit